MKELSQVPDRIPRLPICIFAQGGSMEPTLDAVDEHHPDRCSSAVLSDRGADSALKKADTHGISCGTLHPAEKKLCESCERRLPNILADCDVDVVGLASFMGIFHVNNSVLTDNHPTSPQSFIRLWTQRQVQRWSQGSGCAVFR